MANNIIEKLVKIQATLRCPKGQTNKFGNYQYRSCEDIMEAIKPLLAEAGLVLTLSDRIVMVGGWFFVEASAKLADGNASVEVCASARHEEQKKGWDASQISGSTSSYARKYALGGLFLIDDTRDSDATNTHGKKDASGDIPFDFDADGRGKKASKADLNRIKAAIDKHGADADKVKAMMTGSPFACLNPPADLLAIHVDAVIDRIENNQLEVVK